MLCLAACQADGSGGGTETEGIVTISATHPTTTAEPELDSSGATTDSGLPTCGESEFVLQAASSRVMLVLDKSGSMVTNTWDHDDDPATEEISRWASLHATVDLVTTNFNGSLEFGSLLYPSLDATSSYDESACVVADSPEVAVATANAGAVMGALPAAGAVEEIQGGTPSAAAMNVALEHLQGLGGATPGAILFITDGEANCRADAASVTELFEDYDQALHTTVHDAWKGDGIPTYVVGIAIRDEVLPSAVDGAPDGINPHEQLEQLAQDGGRPLQGGGTSYYATDNQLELEAALSQIVGDQFDCVVGLESPP
ncbi:MAG: VWA domain-containing protein, partial [Deltaproteobacteria bacterium]|nr:VWA domain-containing protein [Deltaproteobacteria bacterium]